MHIVVAGGGYAGLACLIDLKKRAPRARLTLVDPADEHLKLTHLHEALRVPRARFVQSFAALGKRIGFEHVAASAGAPDTGVAAVAEWDAAGVLPLYRGAEQVEELGFDLLVMATGAGSAPLPADAAAVTLDRLRASEPGAMLGAALKAAPNSVFHATVVGGGANGVQFAFALRDALRARRRKARLTLVEAGDVLLAGQPPRVGQYAREQLARAGIEVRLDTAYRGPADDALLLDTRGRQDEQRSDFTVLMPGMVPRPFAIEADRHGRVKLPSGTAERVFGAGDCARFDGRGLNALTAQAAVRKGRQVAQNVARVARGDSPLSYYFKELGYVVSLGSGDAAGWMLFRDNVLTGTPAVAIKHVVEAQYDLFVAGIDTYLV
ncbi:MAG: FAD-dependent oxidoreductase [Pseudomonadota bacterium]